ncbi:class I SAM-dependent methyltransferase [Amycolatopsis rhabdoformis]|uniref:Class I SAM-dependent methyltransferase n=1 Tax=Amycolatopsis rhabdoformis TaxID=1448059 RepID=A0ABZ1I7F4_9PSEU|nr:class I SAM-dependent methyltransferase [Amycolatopsis rhabdoformis]WSE29636.1 class I SAM-dependent methyltransferase [Amycolatopsis rhabdoformis]
MSAHTHDHIDWAERLTQLRTADTLDADAQSAIAHRLVAALPANPTIVDLGCGAGGMSTHFAHALTTHGGGTIILVDATPELLTEAEKSVRAAAAVASAGATDAPATSDGWVGKPLGPSERARTLNGEPASATEAQVQGGGDSGGHLAVGKAGGLARPAPPADGSAGLAPESDSVVGEPDGSAGPVPVADGSTGPVPGSGSAAGKLDSSAGLARVADGSTGLVPGSGSALGKLDSSAGQVSGSGAGVGRSAGVASGVVEVRAVRGDLADAGLPGVLPAADLVWASRVVHHLADQQRAVGTVAAVAKVGGLVALAEGGLDFRCLPWDLGVGRPGLEDRLLAAQAEWFIGMREGIEGAVAMPYGWSVALERADLTEVDSFGALVHHPAPGPELLADYVVRRIARIFEFGADHLTPDDRATLTTLLDPDGPHHLATRRDLYLTGAKTVHCGRRR